MPLRIEMQRMDSSIFVGEIMTPLENQKWKSPLLRDVYILQFEVPSSSNKVRSAHLSHQRPGFKFWLGEVFLLIEGKLKAACLQLQLYAIMSKYGSKHEMHAKNIGTMRFPMITS